MSLRTFIVEDNALLLRGVTEALEGTGAVRVIGSSAGAPGAIALLGSRPLEWQLIVIDLFLRSGSGLDVLQACRVRGAGQRAVVFTNYATHEIRERCLALGADAVFDKSTEIDEMLAYCVALARG